MFFFWVLLAHLAARPDRLFKTFPLCKASSGGNKRYTPAIAHSERLGGVCEQKDFAIQHKLGSGTFGAVYLARHVPTRTLVAIKQVPWLAKRTSSLRAEECTQHALNGSPLIIEHFCTFEGDGFVSFVMEYSGDFKELRPMLRQERASLPSRTVASIVSQLIDATAHIHSRGVVYRDLKTANVLMNPAGQIKLLDFGMSKFFAASSSFEQTFDIDWFLVGVHIYELLSHGKVFRDEYPSKRRWKTLRKSVTCPRTFSHAGCSIFTELVTESSPFWKIASEEHRAQYLQSHGFLKAAL